ncbi:glucosamine-6-phosphate deaminase [Halalkalibacter krulwichiae]|uniref:Glucosamine-6-phosphate deaminase n=1 Tax=Halalkalibacter krulwichiae TaxID=199441 RepID=A0A1X9MCJ3_9BACI|nr:glucosamine-6-phosphate deaminase [Halalkalibacter krulwichiae]ARK29853.1 Glucosamine-6-phosphate deaminase 1 [Halalkalibacter krulwichiae]
MKIIEVENYQEMSKQAAQYIIEKIKKQPKLKLGLATGGTPVGLYQKLIEDHRENGTDYYDVTTFNLDEYIGLQGTDPNSYRYFMNDQLFDHINIQKENTFIPSGVKEDSEQEAKDYEATIKSYGGIDLQILGIGQNGHIGFNEPGTSFESATHIVQLATSTREANARYFARMEDVPTKAITMGIGTIMKSKEILLLISGDSKTEAFNRLVNGEIDPHFPASILRKHPGVTVIADQAARLGVKVHG